MSVNLELQDNGTERNFRFYRNLLENPERTQGIEAEGLYDRAAFDAAQHDPRTTSLTIHDEGVPMAIPLLTPLENAPWFNPDYHARYAGPDTPLVHYGHQSLLYSRDSGAYTEALRPAMRSLAEQKAVLVFDHTDHEANRICQELAMIASDLSVTLTPVAGPEGDTTSHYHYASVAQPIERDPSMSEVHTSFYDAFESGRANGVFTDDRVTVSPSLTPEDTEQIWSFYKPVFDDLSRDDPVHAGFDEREFTSLMQSPDCIKFVYKEGTDVVNLCLLMDIRGCSWMNQYYYQQQFPDKYAEDMVFCSPGVIANPNLGRTSTSLHTMGMVGRVIKQAGVEPVLTFACDTESNKKVPGLSGISLERAGIKTDFKLLGRQLFGLLEVSN